MGRNASYIAIDNASSDELWHKELDEELHPRFLRDGIESDWRELKNDKVRLGWHMVADRPGS